MLGLGAISVRAKVGDEGQGLPWLRSGLLQAILVCCSAVLSGPLGPIQVHLEDSLPCAPGHGGAEAGGREMGS